MEMGASSQATSLTNCPNSLSDEPEQETLAAELPPNDMRSETIRAQIGVDPDVPMKWRFEEGK
jgi:hypothetical protein